MDDFSFLYYLCRLNVVHFQEKEIIPVIFAQGPFSPTVLNKLSLSSLKEQVEKVKNVEPGLVQDNQGLCFFYVIKKNHLFFLGPFISDKEKPSFLNRQFSHRNRMPVLSQNEMDTYLHALTLYSKDTSEFNLSKNVPVKVHNPVFDQENDLPFEDIEKQYAMEMSLRNAIASGNRQELVNLMIQKGDSQDFSYRHPQNPLRGHKNLSIVLNTIGRHSAEKGGLPYHLLHSISEEYALKIEGCRNEEELMKINQKMLLDYCDGVKNYAIGHHSAAIVRVSRYILEHLNRKLSLSELAQIGGVSNSYLSRLFRKETGKTLSGYIREKRVTEARWLLVHGELSVTHIALELGFEDVNYFSRCFSRETGFSPREYRMLQGSRPGEKDFDGLPGA